MDLLYFIDTRHRSGFTSVRIICNYVITFGRYHWRCRCFALLARSMIFITPSKYSSMRLAAVGILTHYQPYDNWQPYFYSIIL